MATVSGCKAWAVGSYTAPGGKRTLILYWNGNRWKVQPSPNPGPFPRRDVLFGVAATSPTNAWAVGRTGGRTLIEHWDGKAWKIQPSPSPGKSGELFGVAATSATNAWAVGNFEGPMVEHWDGKAWKVQPSPNSSRFPFALFGVAATSSTNAWAVGYSGGGTLVEHWDGKAWTRQHSPNGSTPSDPQSFNVLFGVAATSANNAWAAGWSYSHLQNRSKTLIEDSNGTAWKRQRSPVGPHFYNEALFGVAATSPTNAWAVGYYPKGTVIAHWNGTAWKRQRSPNPGPPSVRHCHALIGTCRDVLYGVAATSPTNAWAVGSYGAIDGQERTLALHWNGTAWAP